MRMQLLLMVHIPLVLFNSDFYMNELVTAVMVQTNDHKLRVHPYTLSDVLLIAPGAVRRT